MGTRNMKYIWWPSFSWPLNTLLGPDHGKQKIDQKAWVWGWVGWGVLLFRAKNFTLIQRYNDTEKLFVILNNFDLRHFMHIEKMAVYWWMTKFLICYYVQTNNKIPDKTMRSQTEIKMFTNFFIRRALRCHFGSVGGRGGERGGEN